MKWFWRYLTMTKELRAWHRLMDTTNFSEDVMRGYVEGKQSEMRNNNV